MTMILICHSYFTFIDRVQKMIWVLIKSFVITLVLICQKNYCHTLFENFILFSMDNLYRLTNELFIFHRFSHNIFNTVFNHHFLSRHKRNNRIRCCFNRLNHFRIENKGSIVKSFQRNHVHLFRFNPPIPNYRFSSIFEELLQLCLNP